MHYPPTFLFWSAGEGLTLLEAWSRTGLTNAELARKIGVSPGTLSNWRHKSPALDAAVLRGREWANAAVENALLRRCLGFSVTETTEEETSSGLKTKTAEKYIPPDLSAQMYWLKTRCPETWGEKSSAPGRNGLLPEIIEAVKQLE